MRGEALKFFKNINGPTRKKLGEILAVFQRRYLKAQSMATAKHKFQKLVFNSAKQKLVNFLDDFQKLGKDAFGIAAHAVIDWFIYAKMPPHLKKSINQAHLENGTYDQIVTHLERELELNGLEAPDELHINTVSQQPTNTNPDRPKPTCHHCKHDITEISVACWKNSENELKKIKIVPETKTVTPITLTRTATSTIIITTTTTTTTETVTEPRESRKLFTHPVRHVEKQTTPQRNATTEPMQPIDPLPCTEDRKKQSPVPERAKQSDSKKVPQTAAQKLN